MGRRNSSIERLAAARAAILERSAQLAPEPSPNAEAALAKAVGAERAAALVQGRDLSPEWRAIERREEVYRLSLAGRPVKRIAAELGLSCRHVVKLRARLGVGRRR